MFRIDEMGSGGKIAPPIALLMSKPNLGGVVSNEDTELMGAECAVHRVACMRRGVHENA